MLGKIYAILFFIAPTYIFLSPGKLLSEPLSFDQAISKVLSFSPTLRIADDEIREAAGTKIQSALLPNPVATYSVENVLGNTTWQRLSSTGSRCEINQNTNWQRWKSAESRYEISQLIELGGKRDFRMEAAKFQYYAAKTGFEAKQLAVLNRLLKLFVLTTAAQEALDIALDQTKIADEVYKTVSAKVEAGKVSVIQQNKAEITFSTAQINLDKANAEFIKSKERLAALWGAVCPDFDRVIYSFYEIDSPKPIELCLSDLRDNPQLLKSQMDYMAANQNLHLEKSLAVPDLTVSLGYKTTQDTKNKGMIIGVSIPIPLFNRNQGNIEKAKAQTVKVQNQAEELELALENKLMISHQELMRAYNEAEKIQSTILKSAVQSFELAKEGYLEGKFEYLDMLDSQKTLFEIKEKYIQALSNYHQSRANIEYLNTLEENL